MSPRWLGARREERRDRATGRVVVGRADFRESTFVDDVDFSDFDFGTATFDGATFQGRATFREAKFKDSACFRGVTFEKAVTFKDAEFTCPAMFEYDEEKAEAEGVRPQETVFKKWADFRGTQFEAGGGFGGVLFESRARFGGATFGTADQPADGSFEGARFPSARTFGPMLAWGRLSLDRASFEANVRIGVSALAVSCVRATFLSRSTLEIRFADVFLDDAEFALPSVVGGSQDPLEAYDVDQPLDDGELRALLEYAAGVLGTDARWVWKPRIRSVRRANVGNLTLSELDLRDCQFVGAHNLDGLRFEGTDFATVANVWGTHRRAICEERKLAKKDPGRAEQIARTYRALRKGREDNKDEPGAADFYYGEMEMRRKARRRKRESGSAKRTSWSEWLVLWLYRLFSGYGLRSSRALLALLVTVVAFGIGFDRWPGFNPDQGFGESLLFAAEGTISLVRPPVLEKGVELTPEGRVLQIGVRLLGTLFFGLALLALRGRVKR